MAAAGIALGLPLGVYLLTLAPTVTSLDAPELTTAAYTLGIAHAPGYPLYTLLGWLFSHAFPVGDVAFRLNLLSAVFGAGTTVLVYLVARRLTGQTLPSLAAALMLAFSYWFWLNSLVAEVYGLDTLLLAAMLLLLLEWRDRQQPAALFAFALLFGLSLANRTTSLLFLPAFALYLWLSPRTRSGRVWLAAPIFVALGLLPYLYIPLDYRTGPDYVWSTFLQWPGSSVPDLATPGGFWHLVSAADFRPFVFGFGPAESMENLVRYGGWLAGSFMGVGVVLGLVGIWQQLQTHRRELLLLLGIFLPTVIFYTNYNVADREFMVTSSYLVWALWIAVGWTEVSNAVVSLFQDLRVRSMAPALILVLPLAALLVNYPLVDLSGEREFRETGEELLAQAEPNPWIMSWWIDMAPLIYLQKVERLRPDAQLVFNVPGDEEFALTVAQMTVGNHPLYVHRNVELLRERYDLVPVGEGGWFRVVPKK
jgi:4-amino-4-deoxy-L-arabinose transferase-like glycosyltransferase